MDPNKQVPYCEDFGYFIPLNIQLLFFLMFRTSHSFFIHHHCIKKVSSKIIFFVFAYFSHFTCSHCVYLQPEAEAQQAGCSWQSTSTSRDHTSDHRRVSVRPRPGRSWFIHQTTPLMSRTSLGKISVFCLLITNVLPSPFNYMQVILS